MWQFALNFSSLEKGLLLMFDFILLKFQNQRERLSIKFGEIQKFSRLAEQAGESNNKHTVNCIFV